ncbi:unnamed protein product [Arctogadus glacialis]
MEQDILLFLQTQLEARKSAVNLRGMLAAIKAVRIGEFAISEDGCSMVSRYLRGACWLTAPSRGPQGLLYFFWWSDFHLSQSIELQSLPASAADQLALCPDSSTLDPQRVDFLGFVAGSLSRYHMRSSHLILRLHVHPILPPECGSGTLLRGAELALAPGGALPVFRRWVSRLADPQDQPSAFRDWPLRLAGHRCGKLWEHNVGSLLTTGDASGSAD